MFLKSRDQAANLAIALVQCIVVRVAHYLGLLHWIVHERHARAEIARLEWSIGRSCDWIREMGALKIHVQEEWPMARNLVRDPADRLSGGYAIIQLTCSQWTCCRFKNETAVLIGYHCRLVAALRLVKKIQ